MTDAPAPAHPVKTFLTGLAALLLLLTGGVVTVAAFSHAISSIKGDERQRSLDPFYVAPPHWQHDAPGTLLRAERVGGVPDQGIGWRVLYVTQRADGTPAVSSGLVFAPGPHGPTAPASGRPVVAWAHPTTGMGPSCAPSRTPNVESDVQGLGDFLSSGWVVAATDYAGLGTPGVSQYLVGAAEAHDVLNSVRAARQIPETNAGTMVGIWGHSQGGQAALWAADLRSYAPELDVVATAAAAPAAELPILISHQWNTIYGSLIGAEVLVAYPATYPAARPAEVTTESPAAISTLANKCVESAALDIVVAKAFGRAPLLDKNPISVPSWRPSLAANTPPPPTIPTFIAQGLKDPIVLPGSTAAYLDEACASHAPIQGVFIGDLGHMKAGATAAPIVYTWLQQRFAGVPMTSTCGTRLPVPALSVASG